jgi:hypothetical protein
LKPRMVSINRNKANGKPKFIIFFLLQTDHLTVSTIFNILVLVLKVFFMVAILLKIILNLTQNVF